MADSYYIYKNGLVDIVVRAMFYRKTSYLLNIMKWYIIILFLLNINVCFAENIEEIKGEYLYNSCLFYDLLSKKEGVYEPSFLEITRSNFCETFVLAYLKGREVATNVWVDRIAKCNCSNHNTSVEILKKPKDMTKEYHCLDQYEEDKYGWNTKDIIYRILKDYQFKNLENISASQLIEGVIKNIALEANVKSKECLKETN